MARRKAATYTQNKRTQYRPRDSTKAYCYKTLRTLFITRLSYIFVLQVSNVYSTRPGTDRARVQKRVSSAVLREPVGKNSITYDGRGKSTALYPTELL
jgi:hypothetical protein